MQRYYGIMPSMNVEKYFKENEVEVLTQEESADALLGYTSLEHDMNITEVNEWVEGKSVLDPQYSKEMLWYYDEDTESGVGFVNYSKDDLEVGIYFKHPNWRKGKICRANNQIDLEVFLHIATQLRKKDQE